MTAKPLSNVDTAWLRMEDPTNLMMISGVMVFGAPMDFERLRDVVERGLLRYDRFRQRAVLTRAQRAYWEDDPQFDITHHLKRIRLAPPADRAALEDLASELASTQLDAARPLWQLHLVEEYGPGSALICRLHHCIGDGVALVHLLLSLTSPDAESPAWFEFMEAPAQAQRGRPEMFPRTRRLVGTAARYSKVLVREGMQSLVDWAHASDLAQAGLEGARALAVLVGRWPDPKTIFKGPLGVPKRVAWSEPLPLADVKRVGKALGGTVNDVLLSAVAGAMRRYLLGRGQRADGLNVRAVVPVNMRMPGTEAELGNKFSLFFLSLPVGVADPGERLMELKRRMDGLKGSKEAPVAFGILNAIGMSPKRIQDIVVNIFGSKGTGVMTNVIGPRVPIYLAGAPLESLMFWVPQSGRLGLGVSILSYADKVWLGVITDVGLVPDPEALVAGFHAEFDELLARALRIKPRPTVKEMAARLDEALARLDEVMAEERGATPAPPAEAQAAERAAPARCAALTREGKPCRNRAQPGSDYCFVHRNR